MKLRLTNDSVRLRLLRSDLERLVENGRIEETTRFSASATLTFALLIDPASTTTQLRQSFTEIAIVLPRPDAHTWASTEQVGIYASVDTGDVAPLQLIVEKDFACLDLSDAENVDTFPHPTPGAAC